MRTCFDCFQVSVASRETLDNSLVGMLSNSSMAVCLLNSLALDEYSHLFYMWSFCCICRISSIIDCRTAYYPQSLFAYWCKLDSTSPAWLYTARRSKDCYYVSRTYFVGKRICNATHTLLPTSSWSWILRFNLQVRVEAALALRALAEVDASSANNLLSCGLTTLRALRETVSVEKVCPWYKTGLYDQSIYKIMEHCLQEPHPLHVLINLKRTCSETESA